MPHPILGDSLDVYHNLPCFGLSLPCFVLVRRVIVLDHVHTMSGAPREVFGAHGRRSHKWNDE